MSPTNQQEIPSTNGLWRHRFVLWQLTRRAIEMTYKGAGLGQIWILVSPIAVFAVYAFVFLFVFNNRYGVVADETKLDFAIALFLSLTVNQLFQDSVITAPTLVAGNPNYVKKIVFPLEILILAQFFATTYRFTIGLAICIVATALTRGIGPTSLLIVYHTACLMLLTIGCAWFLSGIGVLLRDTVQFTQIASLIITFMSGVFFSSHHMPAQFGFLRFNPLLLVIEGFRGALIWGQSQPTFDLVYTGAISVIIALLGFGFFSRIKRHFPDYL